MNNSNPKSNRVLELYRAFLSGKTVNKHEMALLYNVNERSIQRDIDTIRVFLSEQLQENGIAQTIEYDRKKDGYSMVSQQLDFLTKGELLSICKILISSRAYTKSNLESLINRLLTLNVSVKDKCEIEQFISNELFNYVDPAHPPFNSEFLSQIVLAIQSKHKIEISYNRLKDKKAVVRVVEPVGILFSEFYFYLMAVIREPDKRDHFENKNDPFPTIYRLDRISRLTLLNDTYTVDYSNRFKEGEYKNRVQYMYGGEPMHITFKYTGPSIEAVLDRLPMSEVTKDDGGYLVSAEVFGSGIKMWLLSQGNHIRVTAPQSFVDEMAREIKKMYDVYW